MDSASVVLLLVSVLTALILGVLIAVTFSMMMTSRAINKRLDELDKHLLELVEVMNTLSESSQAELTELHETLAQQQKVHQSIRATSRLIDVVFRKPALATGAIKETSHKRKLRKHRVKEKVAQS